MSNKSTIKPKKCKCCNAVISKSFRYIYDDEGKELSIEFLLLDCVGKKVSPKNGLDQVICTKCLLQLQQSYEFKKKCLEAVDDSEEDADNDNEANEVLNSNSIETRDPLLEEDIEIETLEEEYIIDETSEFNYEFVETSSTKHEESEDEIKFIEFIDIVEDDDAPTSTLQSPLTSKLQLNEKLSTSLTLPTVKKKFANNVPSHRIKIKPEILAASRTIDVEQIRTSDDLIHILEDDYHSENDSNRKRLTDTTDEFKIPKIEVEDFCDNIEYLDESKPIDLDEYIKQVTLISYDEKKFFTSEVKCVICNNSDVRLKSFSAIVKHMYQEHRNDFNQFLCVINSSCGLFGHLDDLKNHYASDHQDIVTPTIKLKCTTCDAIFDSSIKFVKHICNDDYNIKDSEEDFKCSLCRKQLASRKRFLFHKQFHLPNQRPKFCLVCQTKYEDENSFYEHVMFAHEQVFEHFCSQCDKSFSTEMDLLRHENTHKAQRNYCCLECGKKFIDRQTWNEHSVVHLPAKPLKCDLCDKSYTRKSRLQKHMKSHTIFETSKLTNCDTCYAVFVDDVEATEHYQNIHDIGDSDEIILGYGMYDKVFVCEFCEVAFGTEESVLVHRETHTGDLKFECSYCDSKYDTYSRKRTHLLMHKTQMQSYPVARHYICDQDNCFKSYIHWSSLTAHRKTSHMINPSIIKCPECPETFYRSWKYDYHKKTAHGECEACPICNKGFYRKKSLEMHMQRVHIDDKKRTNVNSKIMAAERMIDEVDGKISCKECGKLCPSRYNAISHVSMVHLKVRNFTCGVCDKSFYQKGDLNDHYRLHTKEKPFTCQYCPYSSRKRSMLVTHERAHTNERPFQCPRCPCAFKRSYVLKNHLKYHDGVKEFQCPIETCGKMFTTNAALNFHCKSKHVEIDTYSDAAADNEQQQQIVVENIVISPTGLTRQQEARVTVKNSTKRKIPKIVYVMPGNVASADKTKKAKIGNSKQSIPCVPIYVVDH